MDLNDLLRESRRSLPAEPVSMTPREQRAHDQFAREFADQTPRTRAALFGSAS